MRTRTCPRCDQEYTDHPALSRRDNATDICPDCGVEEAMIDTGLILPGGGGTLGSVLAWSSNKANAALERDRRFRERVAKKKEDER